MTESEYREMDAWLTGLEHKAREIQRSIDKQLAEDDCLAFDTPEIRAAAQACLDAHQAISQELDAARQKTRVLPRPVKVSIIGFVWAWLIGALGCGLLALLW